MVWIHHIHFLQLSKGNSMDFELSQEVEVYDKKGGSYGKTNSLRVKFYGRKGLKSLNKLQDIIYKGIREGFSSVDSKTAKEKAAEAENEVMTKDDVLSFIEMAGISEKIDDKILDAMETFCFVGDENVKLNKDIQETMDIDDLDRLCEEVLRHFLLEKITQRMNRNSSK